MMRACRRSNSVRPSCRSWPKIGARIPRSKASLAQVAALPAPEEIAPQLVRAAKALFSAPARTAYATSIAPRVDALAAAYAVETLVALGAADGPFTLATLVRTSEIASDQIPLLTRLIEIAQGAGYVAKTGKHLEAQACR